jgi:hypothetical protein
MTSYQFRSSCFTWGSTRLCVIISSKICLVSLIGIFEYILVMSREASVKVGNIGVCFKLWISSVVFFILNEYGSGVNWLIFCLNSSDNL